VTSCTQKLAEVRLQSVGLPVPAVMIRQESVPRGKRILKVIWKLARILGWAPGMLVLKMRPSASKQAAPRYARARSHYDISLQTSYRQT